jgi:23S rRNA (uracil1939-C5)-methyltransferase
LGFSNVQLIEGKVENVLPSLNEKPAAAILDPSRAGCHRRVLDALIDRRVPRVVYVSCDPATLARDLRILCDGGYALVEVQPVDMFPQTFHIESVTTLALG